MWKKRKTKHHRKPRSLLSPDELENWDNISMVTEQKHQCWHIIFRDMTISEITQELNRHWIDPDYIMVAVNRKTGVTVEQMLELGNEIYRDETASNRKRMDVHVFSG